MNDKDFRKKVTRLSTKSLAKKYENEEYQAVEEVAIVEEILSRRGYEFEEKANDIVSLAESNVGKTAEFIPYRQKDKVKITIRAVRVDTRVNRFYYAAYGVDNKVRYAPSIDNKSLKIL